MNESKGPLWLCSVFVNSQHDITCAATVFETMEKLSGTTSQALMLHKMSNPQVSRIWMKVY